MASMEELKSFSEKTTYDIPFFDYNPGISTGTILKDYHNLPAWGTKNSITYDVKTNRVFVSGDNVVVDGYDFTGTSVTVRGNNVTVSNSMFDLSSPTLSYALVQAAGFSGMTVTNNVFDGNKMDVVRGYINAGTSNVVIKYNQFLNSPSDAVAIMNGVVDHNYFSGTGYLAGAHADAIWVPRTTGSVSITNNFVDHRPSGDAIVAPNNAVRIIPEFGNIENVTVSKNVLLGGSYTINVTTAPTSHSISDVRVTDNFVAAGSFGDLYPSSKPADLVYQSNSAVQISPFIGPAQEKVAGTSIKGVAEAVATVTGTAGSDHISANGQLNYIDGEGGRDWISASKGTDYFVYNSITDSSASQPDYITGFQPGVDKIDLSALANVYAVPDGALSLIGSANFTGLAGQVRVFELTSGTSVLTRVDIDLNGDKVADMRIDLAGAPKLSAGDFLLGTAAKVSAPQQESVAAAPAPIEVVDPSVILTGTAGSEYLCGKDDYNYIDGEGGRDWIAASRGVDHLIYNSVSDSDAIRSDYIVGFQTGTDKIDLSELATAYELPGDALNFIGASNFTGLAGQVRTAEEMSGTTLLTRVYVDLNGDRVADMRIELAGAPELSATDFLL